MFDLFEKAVLGMASLRILSGSIEIFAALLILKSNQVEKALMINSALALVGPVILITTTTIGVLGLSDKLSYSKLLWIVLGVSLILIGVKK
ncbi:YqhV family protein [Microaerobacter geothermalis]|uniref:YqhV family protein n=1 Tax=Microaerobacter geothermalis TaxID=674972 RepID=UPI001F2680BE|nr:YqhV family protein [Microaerobacter geothermalis]MCF6094459.1 YqhV family protein [Microaerobacter geothermalis]